MDVRLVEFSIAIALQQNSLYKTREMSTMSIVGLWKFSDIISSNIHHKQKTVAHNVAHRELEHTDGATVNYRLVEL